jgi:hypothetical protein
MLAADVLAILGEREERLAALEPLIEACRARDKMPPCRLLRSP